MANRLAEEGLRHSGDIGRPPGRPGDARRHAWYRSRLALSHRALRKWKVPHNAPFQSRHKVSPFSILFTLKFCQMFYY